MPYLLDLYFKYYRRYIQVAKVMYVKAESCFRLCTSKKVCIQYWNLHVKCCALYDTFQDITNLYELFHTRAILYQIAYKHKTTVIIEYMWVSIISCIPRVSCTLCYIIIIHRLKNGFKEANKCVKVTVKTAMKDPENSEGEVNWRT